MENFRRTRRAVQEQDGRSLRVAVDAKPELASVGQTQVPVSDPVDAAHDRASSRSNSRTVGWE